MALNEAYNAFRGIYNNLAKLEFSAGARKAVQRAFSGYNKASYYIPAAVGAGASAAYDKSQGRRFNLGNAVRGALGGVAVRAAAGALAPEFIQQKVGKTLRMMENTPKNGIYGLGNIPAGLKSRANTFRPSMEKLGGTIMDGVREGYPRARITKSGMHEGAFLFSNWIRENWSGK